jgi:uncharacterized protein (DUF169 family)
VAHNTIIDSLERIFGKPFVGIKAHATPQGMSQAWQTYCAAINETLKDGVTRYVDLAATRCHGARYAFGVMRGSEEMKDLIDHLMEDERFISREAALSRLTALPRFTTNLRTIEISKDLERPDAVIAYLEPFEMMILVQAYEKAMSRSIPMMQTGLMPVCGCCTVQPILTNEMAYSFGCKESREYGGLPDDSIVVGIPFCTVETMIDHIEVLYRRFKEK